MTSAEKWNRIVEYFNRHLNAKEEVVQDVWERILAEFFGYSSLNGEIDIQRTVHTGAANSMEPDIIIKNSSRDLFVVELKRHNMLLDKGMEKQLISYLKQLQNDMGILICNKIYIYDYNYNKSDYEQDRAEIEFEQNNPDGIKFIEMFSKGTFDKATVKEFVRQQTDSAKNAQLIRKELTTDFAIDLLRDYFTLKYDEAGFKQAIKDFDILVTQKTIRPKPVTTGTPIPLRASGSELKSTINKILSKDEAIKLCRSNGLNVSENITFSSRNKRGDMFWANPKTSSLTQDWWLLLNDYCKRVLHVFKIPANSLLVNDIKIRKDTGKIDLQIRCDDDTFQDIRSKRSFARWLVKTIK